jgi:hypothetical protein
MSPDSRFHTMSYSSIRLLSKIGPLLHTRCRDCPFMLFDSASYSQASLAASATLPDSRSTTTPARNVHLHPPHPSPALPAL